MQKLTNFLFGLLTFGLVLVPVPAGAGIQGSGLDQANETLTGVPTDYVSFSPITQYQSFIPTKTTIVSVDLYFKASNLNAIEKITILDAAQQPVAGSATETTITLNNTDTWFSFTYASPYVSVTPGATYYIKLESSTGDVQTHWAYNNNGYSRGALTSHPDKDGNFRIYGFGDPPAAPATPTVSTGTTVKSTTINSLGAVTVPTSTENTTAQTAENKPKKTVTASSKKAFWEEPVFFGGMILILIVLIVLLVYLETKYHGLAAIGKKKNELPKKD